MMPLADLFSQGQPQQAQRAAPGTGAGALANDPGGVMGGLASVFLQNYAQPAQQQPAGRPARPEPGGSPAPVGLTSLFR